MSTILTMSHGMRTPWLRALFGKFSHSPLGFRLWEKLVSVAERTTSFSVMWCVAVFTGL